MRYSKRLLKKMNNGSDISLLLYQKDFFRFRFNDVVKDIIAMSILAIIVLCFTIFMFGY
jgi:hypothetical protein